MMRNHIIKFILLLSLCCFFTGCGSNNERMAFVDSLPILNKESQSALNDINTIGIYVDVTPSMKGFLGRNNELAEETKYLTCLNEIDKFIAIYFTEELISYYRMDTPLWKTAENVLKKAKDSDYYYDSRLNADEYELVEQIQDDQEGYDSLCLTNALLNCKEDDFSVVITDFYENNGEAADVIRALKENMSVPKDKTVGIIGIKSEFSGMVYDYEKNGVMYGDINDATSESELCYRQFYVIVIGYPAIIQEFCLHMEEKMKLNESKFKYIVFYENDLCGLDYTNFEECFSQSWEEDDILYPQSAVRINDVTNIDVYDFYNANGEKDVVVSYKVEGNNLESELQKGDWCQISIPDVGEGEVIEVPYYINAQTTFCWSQEEGHYKDTAELANIFHIEGVYYLPDENILFVWFKITQMERIKGLALKLGCQICYENSASIDGEWIEQWNAANDEVDYGKTKNLKEYVDALRGQMPDRKNILLDFVFYINCK